MSPARSQFVVCAMLALVAASTSAAEPLHRRIDQLILGKSAGKPVSETADDAEFLRRIHLDFVGRIPSADEARKFFQDKDPNKRSKLIDRLLGGPDYAQRMTDVFNVMLMERLGEHPQWTKYLTDSFAQNRPWDRMVHDMLRADPANESSRGAAFFLAKRLENYGQNPVDYPGLTRDIGRLFLGKNFQCAQCHDHLFIDDYKQAHFQGLYAFVQNVTLFDAKAPAVTEKPSTGKVAFMSVFKKIDRKTGPAIPGGKEIEPIVFKKGEEYQQAPNPKTKTPGVLKFSTLSLLADQVATPENKDFSRNIVNRMWFVMMGRGLVHPLDLHHSQNPPSHPQLLDLLAREFVEHKFDIKWMLRELALTQTYQRSSVLPKGTKTQTPELFLTAIEKRISAEQLMWSMLEATGELQGYVASSKSQPNTKASPASALQTKFIKAFANPGREPEEEFKASLKAALFVLNDETVLAWLTPRPNNLMERLAKAKDDAATVDELYLSVLTRLPANDEKEQAIKYLAKNSAKRTVALGQLAWALLASTEFCVNH